MNFFTSLNWANLRQKRIKRKMRLTGLIQCNFLLYCTSIENGERLSFIELVFVDVFAVRVCVNIESNHIIEFVRCGCKRVSIISLKLYAHKYVLCMYMS